MARKRRGKNMRNYLRGNVDENLVLLTLDPVTAVLVVFDEAVIQRTLATSIVATWSMRDFSVGAGDGPVMVGVSHSDYTTAEIEEWIETSSSWSPADKIGQEIAKRQIRMVGTFRAAGQAGGATLLSDGRPIKTKLNWMLQNTTTLNLWAYNLGTSALSTGAAVNVQGHVNLFSV